MKMYHITPSNNFKSIMENGLKVNHEPYAALEPLGAIYFTTSVKKLRDQEGEWEDYMCVFSIKEGWEVGRDFKIDWELGYRNSESPFSFYLEEDIPAEDLKFEGILVGDEIKRL